MTRAVALLIAVLFLTACDKLGLPGGKPAQPTPLAMLKAPQEAMDFIQARASHAAGLNRNVLLHFSLVGCGPCIRLEEEVMAKSEWRAFAKEHFVETILEFPSQITSEDKELVRNMQAMEALADLLHKDAGFPFLVVLGRDGSILGGRSGYVPGGAKGYIDWAGKLLETDTSPRQPASKPPTANPASPATNTSASLPAAQTSAIAPTPSAKPIVPVATAEPTPAKVSPASTIPATNAPVATPCDYLRVSGFLGSGSRGVVIVQAGNEAYNLKLDKEVMVPTPGGKFRVRVIEIGKESAVLLVTDEQGKEHTCRF